MPLVRAFIAMFLLAAALALARSAGPPEPTLPQAEPAQFAAGASATPLPPMPGGPTPTPGVLYSGEPSMPDRIPVRWYVGLGAGSDPTLVEAQTRIVEEFNASQGEIELL